MNSRLSITLDALEKMGPLGPSDVFQATFTPVEGAGFRLFLYHTKGRYEVTGEGSGDDVYFHGLESVLAKLVSYGVISHHVVVDAVGLVSCHKNPRRRWSDHVNPARQLLEPA